MDDLSHSWPHGGERRSRDGSKDRGTVAHVRGNEARLDGSGYVSELLAILPELRIFVGLEELSFPMMALGAVGLMNAVGNLNPRVLAEMCDAVWSGDLGRGREMHERLLEDQ